MRYLKTDEECSKALKYAIENKKPLIDFRLGWCYNPKNIEDVMDILDDLCNIFHIDWRAAIESKQIVAEDISPGEVFLQMKHIIQSELNKETKQNGSEI